MKKEKVYRNAWVNNDLFEVFESGNKCSLIFYNHNPAPDSNNYKKIRLIYKKEIPERKVEITESEFDEAYLNAYVDILGRMDFSKDKMKSILFKSEGE